MTLTFNVTFNVYYMLASVSTDPDAVSAGIGMFVLFIIAALVLKILMIYPRHTEIEITKKGIKCIENKQYEDAIKHFDAAIKINENYSDAYFNKARALIKINENNNAIITRPFVITPSHSLISYV